MSVRSIIERAFARPDPEPQTIDQLAADLDRRLAMRKQRRALTRELKRGLTK